MKLTISLVLYGAYFINISICDYRDNPDSRYRAGSRDSYNQEQQLEFELPHTRNDDRCSGSTFSEDREVTTRFGLVRGKTVSLCDEPGVDIPYRPDQGSSIIRKRIKVFLGIPYAEPPTMQRNLQFKPPQDPSSHPNVINALHYKPSCPQNMKYLGVNRGINVTDEDCLYLNIYAPDKSSPGVIGASPYPVMIFIHGGNWDHGSANLFPAHMLAAKGVVVVTFNYRLGHLGFFSTGDTVSVGNYGILDQQQALKWVYENIHHFDGNSSSITLFGMDAGAVSATLLAMSPHSKHMVKRVIAQNGVPVADWAVIVDTAFAFNTSRIAGEELGCTAEDMFRLLECVGKRSNNEIKILKVKPRVGWLPWGPIVDNFTQIKNFLLPKSPEEMLEEGMPFQRDFEIMTGTSRDEGVTVLLEDPTLQRMNYHFADDVFIRKIKDFMAMYNYSVNAEGIFNAIKFMYMPSTDVFNETRLRQSYIDLLTDRYYKSPNYRFAKQLVKKGVKTFLYVCNYTLQGYRPAYSWQGVSSETEYLLLTGAPFMNPKYYPPYLNLQAAKWTESDRDMSQFYLEAWTNFAKEGNPTPNRVFNTILWEQAKRDNFVFLNLNSTNETTSMIHNYKEKESEFWNCYLPFLIGREPPTLAPTLEPGVEELRIVTGALYGSVAAAALFLIITVVCCILYVRVRRYDSY